MDFNLEFWTLHNRVSYRLGEWNSPKWSHIGRDSYRDSYIAELERAHLVFADNPELSDKLPDDSCDPIIGFIRIYNLCRQIIINDTIKQKKPAGTEQTWRNDAPDYIPNSEAVVIFTKSKMPLSSLTKLLKDPNNKIRYMRKGQRCKVHIGDFREYAQNRYPPDEIANEIADLVLADREALKKQMKKKKNKTGN